MFKSIAYKRGEQHAQNYLDKGWRVDSMKSILLGVDNKEYIDGFTSKLTSKYYLLGRFKWFRKLLRGKWFLIYFEPTHSDLWFKVPDTVAKNYREAGWRGSPLIEDYRDPKKEEE